MHHNRYTNKLVNMIIDRKYIVDNNNKKLAVQLSIETLNASEAKAFYKSLKNES